MKNTITGILSLAKQSRRNSGSLDEFFAKFEPRILAFSRAQNILSTEAWAGADLDKLIEGLLASTTSAVDDAIEIAEKIDI